MSGGGGSELQESVKAVLRGSDLVSRVVQESSHALANTCLIVNEKDSVPKCFHAQPPSEGAVGTSIG